MQKVLDRLAISEKQNQEILWLLKGYEPLQIKGIIPSISGIRTDLDSVILWQKNKDAGKWKIDLKAVGSYVAWASGILGTIFGGFEFLKFILDK